MKIPPIIAKVGDKESIGQAISEAARRSNGLVSCHFGTIRVAAGPTTPIGVIHAHYEEGVQKFRTRQEQ